MTAFEKKYKFYFYIFYRNRLDYVFDYWAAYLGSL